ncbi:MAG: 6-carboxytetrahydropterin synthase [Bacteroidota bacterium]
MNKIRITKEFKFEMAHALMNYDGLCKNIHGHSYLLYVTVIGEPLNTPNHEKDGMVIDFGDLKNSVRKAIIDEFDHALVLNTNIEKEFLKHHNEMFANIVFVDYQPTSENMLIDFAKRLNKIFTQNIKLHSLKLCETATSYAEWFAQDN